MRLIFYLFTLLCVFHANMNASFKGNEKNVEQELSKHGALDGHCLNLKSVYSEGPYLFRNKRCYTVSCYRTLSGQYMLGFIPTEVMNGYIKGNEFIAISSPKKFSRIQASQICAKDERDAVRFLAYYYDYQKKNQANRIEMTDRAALTIFKKWENELKVKRSMQGDTVSAEIEHPHIAWLQAQLENAETRPVFESFLKNLPRGPLLRHAHGEYEEVSHGRYDYSSQSVPRDHEIFESLPKFIVWDVTNHPQTQEKYAACLRHRDAFKKYRNFDESTLLRVAGNKVLWNESDVRIENSFKERSENIVSQNEPKRPLSSNVQFQQGVACQRDPNTGIPLDLLKKLQVQGVAQASSSSSK